MKTTNDLRLTVTLRLLDGEGQRRFGPGVAALLEEVRERRSLRAAAGAMGMAYSRACGGKLPDSTIGGRNGGGAALTPEAEALLADWRALRDEVDAFARRRFGERFGDL